METFSIIAISLLAIQIVLLFMIMSIQNQCDIVENMNNNTLAQPRRIVLGGIPIPANSVIDTPGIEDISDPLSDPTKNKTLYERLTTDIKANNTYSLNKAYDNYKDELENAKSMVGVMSSNPQDGDNKESLYNKTDGLLYENHIKWDRGKDISKYRERLQMNRIEHLDPIRQDTNLNEYIIDKDPNVDNDAISYILTEPRTNLRY